LNLRATAARELLKLSEGKKKRQNCFMKFAGDGMMGFAIKTRKKMRGDGKKTIPRQITKKQKRKKARGNKKRKERESKSRVKRKIT